MIQANAQQLPTQNSAWITGNSLTNGAFYLIRALFLRTGGASGVPNTVGSALVASGANQANGLALANDYNEVLTGSGGVVLAKLQPGQLQWVFNGLAGNLNVYPFLSGEIDGLAVNAPFVLGNGKTQIFTCVKLLASGGCFYRPTTLG